MGFSFWDVMQVVAPVAATVVGGPVAGMAVSGAMGAGTGIAKGEGAKGALLRGAVGAGTGALAAGATGGFSKAAESAAANAALKGATETVGKQTLGLGLEKTISEGAKSGLSRGLTDAVTGSAGKQAFGLGLQNAPVGSATFMEALGQGTGKSKVLQGLADATSKARGKHPEETDAMLKTVGKAAKGIQTTASLFQPDEDLQRFSQVQGMQQLPGMSPSYQYGSYDYSTPVVRTRRYF